MGCKILKILLSQCLDTCTERRKQPVLSYPSRSPAITLFCQRFTEVWMLRHEKKSRTRTPGPSFQIFTIITRDSCVAPGTTSRPPHSPQHRAVLGFVTWQMLRLPCTSQQGEEVMLGDGGEQQRAQIRAVLRAAGDWPCSLQRAGPGLGCGQRCGSCTSSAGKISPPPSRRGVLHQTKVIRTGWSETCTSC